MSVTGRFIVLEGIDGAGTTTQLHRLAEDLEGRGERVVRTCEPCDGPIGRLIREFLRHEHVTPSHEAIGLLFAADRLEHLSREIEPALEAGTHVICDRYVGSSLAYQGSHTDVDWVRTLNSRARAPDITFYIRVSVDTALRRIGLRDGDKRELYERRDSLERTAAAYDRIYVEERSLEAVVLDGERSPDEVFEAIRGALTTS